jgi:2-C-methyl-D-erythritol 4-phosphate cytidylyltransferase/2-C-methyl-D-erythritol 2,4-cyclodiphosphate synthase
MGGPVDAVVVAAGASQRMGGRDKLDARLLGRPLLAWAMEALELPGLVDRLIVVAPGERLAWLDDEPGLRERIEVVPGGVRRQESVAAGVRASSAATVLIHDGARPLATTALAQRVAEAALAEGAAIPVVPLAETVKRLAGNRVVETVPRDDLAAAQTPQGFRRELLERAWAEHPPSGAETWTDEAALLEAAGIPVRSVPGEVDNLKVTVADDLVRAERLLAARLGQEFGGGLGVAPGGQVARTGFGRDSHPFGPGDGLALGGIRIPDAPALFGHSDGDVALHAVADALLGAAALGDLGRLFPAGDPATRGVAGAALLEGVLSRLQAEGYAARAVDVTIVGARPRLGEERLEAMRAAIASLLGLDVARISVKASSGNLAGDEGAGRVISARAVATVVERPPG